MKKVFSILLVLLAIAMNSCSLQDPETCSFRADEIKREMTATGAFIQWEYPNGVPSGYWYSAEYGEEGFARGTGKRYVRRRNTDRFRLGNLKPKTTYDVYFTRHCDAGEQQTKFSFTTTSN